MYINKDDHKKCKPKVGSKNSPGTKDKKSSDIPKGNDKEGSKDKKPGGKKNKKGIGFCRKIQLWIQSNPILSRLLCCCTRKEDKIVVETIKKEGEKLDKILDLEVQLKLMKKLSFFQEIIMKKLQIDPRAYKWNFFDRL